MCTSQLALGEIMSGAYRDKDETTAQAIRERMMRANIRLLPFDQQAVEAFARIGAEDKTAAADFLHLAGAASSGVDVFITTKGSLSCESPGSNAW
jgi:predicted nucleic acid-binding protein